MEGYWDTRADQPHPSCSAWPDRDALKTTHVRGRDPQAVGSWIMWSATATRTLKGLNGLARLGPAASAARLLGLPDHGRHRAGR